MTSNISKKMPMKSMKFRSSYDYMPTPYRDKEDVSWDELVSINEVCKGLTMLECARTMNRERDEVIQQEEDRSRSYVKIIYPGPTGSYKSCVRDEECKDDGSEICLQNMCVPKQSFPLTLRQQLMRQSKMQHPVVQRKQSLLVQPSSVQPIKQNKQNKILVNSKKDNQNKNMGNSGSTQTTQTTHRKQPTERYSANMSPHQINSYLNLKTSSMGDPTPNRMTQSQYTMLDNAYLQDWSSLHLPPSNAYSPMYPRTRNLGKQDENPIKSTMNPQNAPIPQFIDFFPLKKSI